MRVLVGVLDMGLGHATRMLPIIGHLRALGHEVMLASGGRALELLRQTYPDLPAVALPSYRLRYTRGSLTAYALIPQIPRLLQDIRHERALCRRLVASFRPDVILSDLRYGFHHEDVFSVLLTNQIYYALPRPLQGLRRPAGWLHVRTLLRPFDLILIPDEPDKEGGWLSGKLTEVPAGEDRFQYVGLLSSLPPVEATRHEPLDLLAIVSGPEPQRTVFEERLRGALRDFKGRAVMVLGRPEAPRQEQWGSVTVYGHVSRHTMAEFLHRARCVVTRPGFSTLTELVEHGKKALFVPTPGQTEQEYLARRMHEKGWFLSVPQRRLDLPSQIVRAQAFPGLYRPGATRQTLKRIMDVLEHANG